MLISIADCARAVLLRAINTGGRGTQADIADRAGVSRSALNDFIKGRKAGSDEFRARIAAALGLTYEEMLASGRALLASSKPKEPPTRVGVKPWDTTMVPLLPWERVGHHSTPPPPTSASTSSSAPIFGPSRQDETWLAPSRKYSPRAFALSIRDDSMLPEFTEGEIIVVDPERPAISGSFVVARLNGQTATCKRLIIDSGRTFLAPLNNRYPVLDVTDKKLEIIGVVVEKLKRY